jgi:hypothetical protein
MTDPSSPTTDLNQNLQQSHVEDTQHRHAKLKNTGTLRRDTSKRPKTNAPGSRTLSPTSPHRDEPRNDEMRSPLYCPIPTNADPTVALALRFQGIAIISSDC